jgi:hypothetical protein
MVQQSIVRQGLITEASRFPSDTSHSVGLLWTSDQLDAEKYTWQHTTLTTEISKLPAGLETTILESKRTRAPRSAEFIYLSNESVDGRKKNCME